ncbi:uncharacterized protein [Procambarus clarkii]|uniref:uncharacterized protein n=1 Tax=Procambarus clarkii TaxID=6728 RepID=UPI0037436C69
MADDEHMEEGEHGEGGGGGEGNPHKAIQFKTETLTFEMHGRRYIEIETLSDSKSCYFQPLDILEFYTYGLDQTGEAIAKKRWATLRSTAFGYGMKINEAGFLLHSMIPLQDILKNEAGTPIEQTTPNIQTFMEIFKDTNYSYGKVTFPSTTTLAKWLENPQQAKLDQSAVNPEWLIATMGHYDTMRPGDRKAFTIHPDNASWYKIANASGVESNKWNYLPLWGGARAWTRPSSGVLRYNPMRADQTHGIFMRMTPVKDTNGALIKFRARITMEHFINITIRLPPDGMETGPSSVYNQHLQALMAQNNVTEYIVNHPF